ncbi:NAD(P)/FAD-dependent oxidoreductase [Exiguobacterium sp. SL-10]|uniref:dihydrolipoyl dehydrogenase family protein n=1 Tax=unclassified Exiguobacterium TaxID=2644629 RepID=UPI00103B5368|nr:MULTISPECIES: NAD(P)/FAD-dependent oxidoreductase [unclassified Exiguobacterium]TCI20985.1 NAD(P)/FAD-dependent oxidoreductase [Exiguobacterium sp. SL-9]TCI31257.1 NAD(P)/FAD-dependent oxidoreductase [Exiguobacterium sp. SL-10]
MKDYQLIVIGGGAAGMTVAAGAANLGAKVALVEKKKHLGGDCLHVGCVPSKALIAASKEASSMMQAARVLGAEFDGRDHYQTTKARVDRARAIIQDHDGTERFEKLGVDVYIGEASFQSPYELKVGDDLLIGKKFVIATGSKPTVPPIDGLDSVPYLTNEQVFEEETLPESIIVIGAGTVGLELAQSFARLGSQVTVLEAQDTFLPKEDESVSKLLRSQLEMAMRLKIGVKVKQIAEAGGRIHVTTEVDGETVTYEADKLLMATGRKPRIDELRLDRAHVNVKDGYIDVSSTYRTSQPHIFAIGDTIKTLPFTHAAGEEGKAVVANALFGLWNKVDYTKMPWITFTEPEVFHVGMTEAEARERHGDDVEVFEAKLSDVDRFVADRQETGFVKIITRKNGKIIGGHAVGMTAGDWMQIVVYAMQRGDKIGKLSRMIYPYPSRSEAVKKVSDLYWRKRLFNSPLTDLSRKYFEWTR